MTALNVGSNLVEVLEGTNVTATFTSGTHVYYVAGGQRTLVQGAGATSFDASPQFTVMYDIWVPPAGSGTYTLVPDSRQVPVSYDQATGTVTDAASIAALQAVPGLGGGGVVTLTASRALTSDDSGKTLVYAGSTNITLTTVAALGSFVVIQGGSGTVTVTGATKTPATTGTNPVIKYTEVSVGAYRGDTQSQGGITTTRHKSAMLRRLNSFIANGNGTANNITASVKFEVPFEFTWVRLWIFQKSSAAPGVSTAFKAIVAPTETFANDTDINRYVPIIGGAQANVMASGNQNGWKNVTWAGAATVQTPQVTYTNNHLDAIAASDRIYVNSIPRTDGGTGRLLMVRLNLPNDSGVYNNISSGLNLHNATFTDERIQYRTRAGADGVGTLANYPTGAAQTFDSMLNVCVEFGTNEDVGTFLVMGDSISTYSLTLNAAGMDTWNAAAIKSVLPKVGYFPVACGSTDHAEWQMEFDKFFEKETNNSVKYLLLPVQSPNFSFDLANTHATLNTVDKILDACAEKGIKVFLWTPYYFPAENAANINVAVNFARAAAAAGRCVLVDIRAAIPSGTAHLLGDNIHPNNTGTAIMRDVLAAALAANI